MLKYLQKHKIQYRDELLNDTLPFWTKHSLDLEYGGFLTFLDQDGSIVSTDKPVWVLGRIIWLFSELYNKVEKKQEWLDIAEHGIAFLRKYAFDSDGRMFFSVTRDGKPLRKRRYLFTETFAIIALAEYAKASGDDKAKKQAIELYKLVINHLKSSAMLEPKVYPSTRRLKSLAMPMIMLATTSVIREIDNDLLYKKVVDKSLFEILNHFLKPELRALLENVGPNGDFLDESVGREINPGHALETAWFILSEARFRNNDSKLVAVACDIIDWSLEIGWDKEYGGIYYFRDVKTMPCQKYEHDMKLWWPHNEAIYATLLAYHMTANPDYLSWYEKIYDWTYKHFPDSKNGEWFGYLHRDGSISSTLKGNMWKGPFHLPRMQLNCWKLLEEMDDRP